MAFLRYFYAKLHQPLANRTTEMWERLVDFLSECDYRFCTQDNNTLFYKRGALYKNLYSFDPRNLLSWLIVSMNARGINYRFIADCSFRYLTPWEETVWLFELDQIAEYVVTGNRLVEQSRQLARERRWAMMKHYASIGMTSYYVSDRWHHLYKGKIIRRQYYANAPSRSGPKVDAA
jgi:hypothetical protein